MSARSALPPSAGALLCVREGLREYRPVRERSAALSAPLLLPPNGGISANIRNLFVSTHTHARASASAKRNRMLSASVLHALIKIPTNKNTPEPGGVSFEARAGACTRVCVRVCVLACVSTRARACETVVDDRKINRLIQRQYVTPCADDKRRSGAGLLCTMRAGTIC